MNCWVPNFHVRVYDHVQVQHQGDTIAGRMGASPDNLKTLVLNHENF